MQIALKAGFYLAGFLYALTSAAQTVSFTELNYHSDSTRNSGDWLELYNYGGSAVDLTGWYLKDAVPSNRYDFPSGTLLQPGNYLVVAVDLIRFGNVYPGVSNVIGEPAFRYNNAGECLTLYDATDAEVAAMCYEDTVPWTGGADGWGRTLQVIDPQADLSDPLNWYDGCMFGTPGGPALPCDPEIVFSEINYNPPNAPNAGDWVEILNRSPNPILLTGWFFRDQRDTNTFTIPTGTTIDPGAYLVLARRLDSFQAVYPAVSNVLGSFDFNLSGDGEVIRLFGADGFLLFSAVYNDAFPWSDLPDGQGYTLELVDPTGPMNEADSWIPGCLLGSPGMAFDPWCWGAVDDPLIADPGRTLPLRAWAISGSLFVSGTELAETVSLRLFDLTGRLLDQQSLQPGSSAQLGEALPSAIYLIEARSAQQSSVLRVALP